MFRFDGTFSGEVAGVDATGELTYAGVTRAGGSIDANIKLRADGAKDVAYRQCSAWCRGYIMRGRRHQGLIKRFARSALPETITVPRGLTRGDVTIQPGRAAAQHSPLLLLPSFVPRRRGARRRGSMRRRFPAGMGECLVHDHPLAVEARQREEVSE